MFVCMYVKLPHEATLPSSPLVFHWMSGDSTCLDVKKMGQDKYNVSLVSQFVPSVLILKYDVENAA